MDRDLIEVFAWIASIVSAIVAVFSACSAKKHSSHAKAAAKSASAAASIASVVNQTVINMPPGNNTVNLQTGAGIQEGSTIPPSGTIVQGASPPCQPSDT